MKFPLVVIPAAGKGTRMGGGVPKCLRLVNGEPIIRLVYEFWAPMAQECVILVPPGTRHEFEKATSYKESYNSFWDQRRIIEGDWASVPAAILDALQEVRCPRRFAVALGDCLFDGTFDFDGLSDFHGVAVDDGDPDFARSYAVKQLSDYRIDVMEKPKRGVGAFFFNWLALPALHNTAAVDGGIVDVVAALPGVVKAIPFSGKYLNCTTPEDLERW